MASQKPTILYATYTAEMRSDQDTYMLGLDKCYTSLEQANARVELLGRCNVNYRSVETKLAQTDNDNGCLTVSWGRYGSQVRFLAQARRFIMAGKVLVEDQGCTSPGGWDKDEIGLFFAETQLDVAGHVWVVAVHDPVAPSFDGITRRHSLSHGRRSSMSRSSNRSSLTANLLSSVNSTDEQRGLGWKLDSVHANSEKALNRAKKAWNEHFRQSKGRCKKIREHYGFARYAFKPASTSRRDADYETCLQIRVERIRVIPVDEVGSEFAATQAMERSKAFMSIMPPLKNTTETGRAFEGQLVNAATGQRSSFVTTLQNIADEALQDGYDYERLPLAFKIRHEHMLRWGALDGQRHGGDEKNRDSKMDLYHALLYDKVALNPKGHRHGAKVPTQAFVRARKRMIAAPSDVSTTNKPSQDSGSSIRIASKAQIPTVEFLVVAPKGEPVINEAKPLPRSVTMRKKHLTVRTKVSPTDIDDSVEVATPTKASRQAPAKSARHTTALLDTEANKHKSIGTFQQQGCEGSVI